jgi:hypothetical protein
MDTRGQIVRLNVLQAHVNELRQGVTVTDIGPQAQKQLRELLHLSETACQAVAQQKLLGCLGFSDMHMRFETVHRAHLNTFRWIYDTDSSHENGSDSHSSDRDESSEDSDSPYVNDENDVMATRVRWLNWLTSGNGIFHIAGKLGSGKSTLMRFLCDEPQTEIALQRWAGMTWPNKSGFRGLNFH